MLTLSRALFGLDLKLTEFPVLKSIHGLGFSDSDTYSGYLESRFSYANTFYDRQPCFDLLRPDEKEFGKYDFLICSDVLEHVPAPIDRAFLTLGRLLKPTGILIVTVPYSLETDTIEHYPDLTASVLTEIGGRTVLVGRSSSGKYRVFDQLEFHGGIGSTLEQRIFSDAGIRAGLARAGFVQVRFDPVESRAFGVVYAAPCSLPIVARRGPLSFDAAAITELVGQWNRVWGAIEASRWIRLGRIFGVGPRREPRS